MNLEEKFFASAYLRFIEELVEKLVNITIQSLKIDETLGTHLFQPTRKVVISNDGWDDNSGTDWEIHGGLGKDRAGHQESKSDGRR